MSSDNPQISYAKSFNEVKYSDIKIKITTDGRVQILHLHKVILAATSSYFDRMFNNESSAEVQNGLVDFTGREESGAVIKCVLKLIYNIDITADIDVNINGYFILDCIKFADYLCAKIQTDNLIHNLARVKTTDQIMINGYHLAAKINNDFLKTTIIMQINKHLDFYSAYVLPFLSEYFAEIRIALVDNLSESDKFMIYYRMRNHLPAYMDMIATIQMDQIPLKNLKLIAQFKDINNKYLQAWINNIIKIKSENNRESCGIKSWIPIREKYVGE